MAVFIVQMVFIILSNVSYFLSRFVFSSISYFLVLLINTFKVPGQNAQGLVQYLGETIKLVLQYLLDIALEAISAITSVLIDLLKEGLFGSVSTLSSTLLSLVEQTRCSLQVLVKVAPELYVVFKDAVSTIFSDLLNNSKDAFDYLTKNA